MNHELGGPALRAFFAIAERWSLSPGEQMQILGLTSRSALQCWKSKARREVPVRLARDSLERISYVLGIYKAINVLLPNESRANKWIRTENKAPIFGGKSALARMSAGNVGDLYMVRRYLDSQLA